MVFSYPEYDTPVYPIHTTYDIVEISTQERKRQ
nr:MAG TPA: hypothetical protein [Caudoviricetes sp.]